MNTLKIPALDAVAHLDDATSGMPVNAPNPKNLDFIHWKTMTKGTIAMIFGDESSQLKDFVAIRWTTDTVVWGANGNTSNDQIMATKQRIDREAMERGFAAANGLLKILRNTVAISGKTTNQSSSPLPTKTNKVFIVHGHDAPLKNKVARYISELGLRPIILDEQPNKGRTVIEKFEQESGCDFAVVLATGDDLAAAATELHAKDPKAAFAILEARARQNAVFELGYFVAKIGRGKVMLITEKGVELPSDLSGIVHTLRESWSISLWAELKAGGFNFDADQIYRATAIGS